MIVILMMILMNGKAERLTPLSECHKTTISHYESWVNGGGCLFGPESREVVVFSNNI